MNMEKWLTATLQQKNKRPMPILSFPGIQLLGITVKELVQNSDLMANCMKAIADRYPALASVSNMDLSVEAEAFGAVTRYDDNEVPSIIGRLIENEEDARALKVPPIGAGRTGACVEAIRMAVQRITDRPLFAGIIGPYSLAGRLLEMTELMYKAMDEPETVHLVLERATQFLLNYSRALKAAGANGIVIAEPAAGLLSPDWNKTFSTDYIRRLITEVQDDSFLVIYHNCGNVMPLIEDIIATGARAFHFGNAINLRSVIDKIPASNLVMGNLDPAAIFAHGTEDTIVAAVKTLQAEMKGHTNFVLSSGCDIPPSTPLAVIDAFFTAANS